MLIQTLKHLFRATGATALAFAATRLGDSPAESITYAGLLSTAGQTDWASRLTCTYAAAASTVAIVCLNVDVKPFSVFVLLLGALFMFHPKGANALMHLPLWVLLLNVMQVAVILLYLPRP